MFSVEVHEKLKDNTHGSLVRVLGIFDKPNDARQCKFEHESVISDTQLIDIYEVESAKPLENKGLDFFDEQVKMSDFFSMPKDDFLRFYSYLNEDDYEETRKIVIEKSGYFYAEELIEDKGIDGIALAKIVRNLMMIEWLHNR